MEVSIRECFVWHHNPTGNTNAVFMITSINFWSNLFMKLKQEFRCVFPMGHRRVSSLEFVFY